MYHDLKKVKSLVEKILQENPAARNSDKKLILEVWKYQGLELTPEQQEKFMRVFSPESIRRNRQKIQAEGKYKPEEKVAKFRASEQRAVREEVLTEDEKMRRLSKQVLL